MSKVYQICFTNDTTRVGGVSSSGWSTVAYSENIPGSASIACDKFLNSKILTSNRVPLDENGQVLNLFELRCDASFLYITRTQYGLKDHAGRQNFFAHTFILPLEDVITDPGSFLTIDNSCFKQSKQEAEPNKDSIELKHTEKFNFRDLVNKHFPNKETYVTLVRCVCKSLQDGKILYIQYDGKESTLKEILFCLYTALPLTSRLSLSIASCNVEQLDSNVNIIFSMHAKDNDNFVDPLTGENNVFTGEVGKNYWKHIDSLGYVDHVARFCDNEGVESFPAKFHEKFEQYGNYKIAYRILTSPNYSELQNVEELFTESAQTLQKKYHGKHKLLQIDAAELLKILLDRKEKLSDKAYELLKSVANSCSELQEQSRRYDLFYLTSLSTEDALNILHNKTKEDRLSCLAQLQAEHADRLKEFLRVYYSQFVLKHQTISFNFLCDTYEEYKLASGNLHDNDSCIKQLYSEEAKKIYSKAPDYKNYLVYANFLNKISPDNKESMLADAKKKYWEEFSFANFEFIKNDEYRQLKADHEKSKISSCLCELQLNTLGDVITAYDKVKNILDTCHLRVEERKVIFDKLKQKANEKFGVKANSLLEVLKSLPDVDATVKILQRINETDRAELLSCLSKNNKTSKVSATYFNNTVKIASSLFQLRNSYVECGKFQDISNAVLNDSYFNRATELYSEHPNFNSYEDYRSFLDLLHISKDKKDNALNDAKRRYWERLTSTDFSFDNENEYRVMQCKNAGKLASFFIALATNLNIETAWNDIESVFKLALKFNDLFKQYGDYRRNKQEIATKLIEKVAKRSGNDPLLHQLLNTLLKSEVEQNLVDCLRSVVASINAKSLQLQDNCKKLSNCCQKKVLREDLFKWLLDYCYQYDKNCDVPWRVWFVLSEQRYGSKFAFLNDYQKPYIISHGINPFENCNGREKELLEQEAKVYINSPSCCNKKAKNQINKWLNPNKDLHTEPIVKIGLALICSAIIVVTGFWGYKKYVNPHDTTRNNNNVDNSVNELGNESSGYSKNFVDKITPAYNDYNQNSSEKFVQELDELQKQCSNEKNSMEADIIKKIKICLRFQIDNDRLKQEIDGWKDNNDLTSEQLELYQNLEQNNEQAKEEMDKIICKLKPREKKDSLPNSQGESNLEQNEEKY